MSSPLLGMSSMWKFGSTIAIGSGQRAAAASTQNIWVLLTKSVTSRTISVPLPAGPFLPQAHTGFVRSSLQMDACAMGLRENHACHTRFLDGAPKGRGGRRGEAVSPIQSSLRPCYKGPRLNYVHNIWICAGAYNAAATHPYPTGTSVSLLSTFLRPNQARVAWGRQAPGRAASASEECSRLQGGRLQFIEERDSVTTTNINQPTNHKWIVTLIRQ